MGQSTDTNAAIWKSEEVAEFWSAKADERERKRSAQWRFMGELLPFGEQDAFTFLDLGAGTGAAARAVLGLYPRSTNAKLHGLRQMPRPGISMVMVAGTVMR